MCSCRRWLFKIKITKEKIIDIAAPNTPPQNSFFSVDFNPYIKDIIVKDNKHIIEIKINIILKIRFVFFMVKPPDGLFS